MEATLRLLGQFSLTGANGLIPVDTQSARLLAALALSGRTNRAELSGLLWPEAGRARALANMRAVVWRMPEGARRLLVGSCRELSLRDEVDVDVHRLCLRRRPDGLSPAYVGLGFDLDLLSAPLLTGWYDEWVIVERERVRACQVELLQQRASAHLERGEPAAAVMDATWAVSIDPLNEAAHQLLLRSHLAEGNVNEAIRHFSDLRRLLNSELGVSPFPDTMKIMEPCLR
ncbi:MAG: bacterial transcriptional activator domain-containing protein [Acidimicrobiia bacterium]|nr:bacterial transcriptional activator domain-containing protein [Acidimicrobiia bacterium]